MPDVIFSHPAIDPQEGRLKISTGANQITWGYGLNTAVYPTYGGEVVQVLSAYTDDLRIGGDVKTYAQMERIYHWFLRYMQLATQPTAINPEGYSEVPVEMYYPHRNWRLQIRPTSLPGFRYGREVVAPSWQLQASVVEEDQSMVALTMDQAIKNGFTFKTLHAGIGYDDENPFTDPAASKDLYDPEEMATDISDFYKSLIPSYLEGDFETLFGKNYGSKPVNEKASEDGSQDITVNATVGPEQGGSGGSG